MLTTQDIVNKVLGGHHDKYNDAFQILDKTPTTTQVESHLISLGFSKDCVNQYMRDCWSNHMKTFLKKHDDEGDAPSRSVGLGSFKALYGDRPTIDPRQQINLQDALAKSYTCNVIRPNPTQLIIRKDIS